MRNRGTHSPARRRRSQNKPATVRSILVQSLQIMGLCAAYFLVVTTLGYATITHDLDASTRQHQGSTFAGVRSTADHRDRGDETPCATRTASGG